MNLVTGIVRWAGSNVAEEPLDMLPHGDMACRVGAAWQWRPTRRSAGLMRRFELQPQVILRGSRGVLVPPFVQVPMAEGFTGALGWRPRATLDDSARLIVDSDLEFGTCGIRAQGFADATPAGEKSQ